MQHTRKEIAMTTQTATPCCAKCGEPLPHARGELFITRECHPCRGLRLLRAEIETLAARIIRAGDFDALEAAAGALVDICLERGL